MAWWKSLLVKQMVCVRPILASLCMLIAKPAPAEDRYWPKWHEHGFSSDSHAALVKHLHQSVADGEVPGGAIMLMHEGEVVFRQAFGFAHVRRELPFVDDGPFTAASISKSIIATLIVKLAAEKVLDLDQPIGDKLPVANHLKLASGQKPVRTPTLRECLHHTAGFRADDGPGVRPWLQWKHKGLTLADVIEHEAEIPLSQNPAEKFAYSGIGYDFAGRVVEVVTEKSIEDVLQEYLCQPLGMNDTTFYPSEEDFHQLPSFYWRHRSDGKLVRQRTEPYIPPGEYKSIGGGIVTTINDLGRLLLMHQNEGLVRGRQWIETSVLQEMYLRTNPGPFYGLGFVLGPADSNGLAKSILHTGSSGTMFWCDRERQMIGVIATQHRYSDGAPMPESEKKIPVDAPSWVKSTKSDFIDPVFGWDF